VLRIAPEALDVENPMNKDPLVLEPGAFLASAQRVISGTLDLRHTETRLQDEGSQLVAELLGSASLTVNSILDCCAAPGGKTAILADRYPNAHVIAWDVSVGRLERMRERFKASPSLQRIVYQEADATEMPVEILYDLVLCDVPCSGTGTLSRNPEIKYRLRSEDLQRQQQRHLAPGGRLLYSTCSLEPEESEHVVERVLPAATGVRVLPIADRLRELLAGGVLHEQGAQHLLEHAVQGDFLRTIPGISACDGFFAALITRE
jgi:16S rRNA (cytosine967-C5)-methyltransferase